MKSRTSRTLTTAYTQPFAFRCSPSVFHPDEIEALLEQGSLMESLAAGKVRPTTAEQRHFLLVDSEGAEPRSIAERAWVRLKARREFEQEEMEKAPLTPSPDYGMVEFDADRCWW